MPGFPIQATIEKTLKDNEHSTEIFENIEMSSSDIDAGPPVGYEIDAEEKMSVPQQVPAPVVVQTPRNFIENGDLIGVVDLRNPTVVIFHSYVDRLPQGKLCILWC